jgi:hypothetical protein
MAIFVRDRGTNSWLIRTEPLDGPVNVGDFVRVYKRNGQVSNVRVTRVVTAGLGESLCEFTDERRSTGNTPPRGVPVVERIPPWNSAARRNLDEARAATAAPVTVAPPPVAPPTTFTAPPPVAPPTTLSAIDWRALGASAARAEAPPVVRPRDVRDIVIAGAAAEGNGVLTGWEGAGALPLSVIDEILAAAELPGEWAPSAKSASAHLGKACTDLNHDGYVARRAESPKGSTAETRNWRVRWVIFRVNGNRNDLVEIELPTNHDELRIYDDPDRRDEAAPLIDKITARYRELREGVLFEAGDVTSWLSATLRARCGAARYSLGYYVPAAGRELATRLVAAASERWGKSWASPPLPVATGPELVAGLARGFLDEVKGVTKSLATSRERARAEKREDIRPGEAAGFLRDLGTLNERLGDYRALCGDEAIRPTVVELGALREELLKLTDDASVRFSLLELKVEAEIAADAAPVAEAPNSAERAADAATEARRADPAVRVSPAGESVAEYRDANIKAAFAVAAKPAVEIDPDDKAANDSAERFALLELD